MTTKINGTGTAASPAITGADTDSGLSFGTDTVNISTGGTTKATIDSAGALDVPSVFPIKVNGSEKLRLTSTGRIGIGEDTPQTALHISGTGVEDSRLRCTRGSASAEFGLDSNGDLILDAKGATGSDGDIVGYAGGAQRFRVFQDGRFVLGSPTVNTTVDHSLVAAGRIQTDGTYSSTTSSSANVRIGSNGLLNRVTSSARYKKDITDATWGLADVLKLKPKTFKSNATGEDADDNTYGGFIAEDLHDIGLTNFVEYNSDNQPDAIHYGNIVSLLTKAIQELNTKITTLETKVAALEAG